MSPFPDPDPYRVIARYYDLENQGFSEDLNAYLLLAERFGGPVLDVGCGTGRVAIPLAEAGCSVTGIERSPEMLEQAKTKSAHLDINWIAGDIKGYTTDQRFGLILFPYHGLMHILEQDDQVQALGKLLSWLKPGGGLALDLPDPMALLGGLDTPGLVVERIFEDEASGATVIQQSHSTLDRAAQRLDVTWVYDRTERDGSLKRDMASMSFRIIGGGELSLLLKLAAIQADLTISPVEKYGTYDFDPYEENSPRLFTVVARV
jgi:SAM-dependent methyltransferase